MTERPYETQESMEQASTWDPADTGTPTVQGSSTTYATGNLTADTPDVTREYPAAGMTTSQPSDGTGTAAVVKDEAASVAQDAKAGTARVADTAKSEVKDVAAETTAQVKHLLMQLRTELNDQASTQNGRAVGGLRSIADELSQMVSGTGVQQPGIASDLAQQASSRAREFAGWLEGREPGELLDEVRSFARRKPGTFLLAAAAVGVIGGRLTRGLTADGPESSNGSRLTETTASYPAAGAHPSTDPYPTTPGVQTPSTYAPEEAYPAPSTYAAGEGYPATETYPVTEGENGLGRFGEERA